MQSRRPSILNTVLIAIVLVLILIVGFSGILVFLGDRGQGPLAALSTSRSATATPTISATATIAGTATPAPTQGTTPVARPTVPTAPAGYITFTSLDLSFGLDYPRTWSTFAASPLISNASGKLYPFRSPDRSEYLQIGQANDPIDVTAISQDAQTYIKNAQGSAGTFGTATSFTSGLNTWTRIDGAYTSQAGQTIVMTVLEANHSNKGYILIYTNTLPTATPDTLSTFKTMISTFTFLS